MRFALIIFLFAWFLAPLGGAADEPLRSLAQMRELSPEELAGRPAVEVEGICVSPLTTDGWQLVLWQEGVGMYVSALWAGGDMRRILPEQQIEPGDRLRVTGHVWEGNIAPVIVPTRIEWLGRDALPEARPTTLAEMRSDRLASQWVRVDGVVQAVKQSPESDKCWSLQIGTPQGRFALRFLKEENIDPTKWIDAAVSIQGVCLHIFNHRNESVGPRMHADGASAITVLTAAPADPFAVTASPQERLQLFTPHETMPHRRKISGMVTLCYPGSYLYLQDGDRGVKVKTSDLTAFQPGDLVEVAGFIVPGDHFLEVHHAVLRKVGSGSPPVPLRLKVDSPDLLQMPFNKKPIEHVHGRLIEWSGVLELDGHDPDGRWFSVANQGSAVFVRLPPGMGDIPRRGSVVRLIGICELLYPNNDVVENFSRPTGIQLLLRDAADLTVLQSTSWWTPQRLWMVVAAVAALLILALVWVRTLRIQIQQRGMALASEISGREMAEMRTAERTRIAEDLHDTLAQGLTGVSLQLEAVGRAHERKPDELPRHLSLARQILHSSRDEIRRALWNLRSGFLDTDDLLGSLNTIADHLSPDRKPEISCRCEGEPVPLPDTVSHTLLRIAQEALSNAIKYASATQVEVVVAYGANEVTLTVWDNGCGFHVDGIKDKDTLHFGLQGIRDRARRKNGQARIDSIIGKGTTVTATIPHSSNHSSFPPQKQE